MYRYIVHNSSAPWEEFCKSIFIFSHLLIRGLVKVIRRIGGGQVQKKEGIEAFYRISKFHFVQKLLHFALNDVGRTSYKQKGKI